MTTILVVDDSTVDRTLAAGLLAKDPDLDVIQAADGKSALALIKVSSPDVIITDLQMPEMSGLEFIAALRKSHSHVPVIMMTSKGSEEIAVEALQSGASSYVPKRQLSTMLVDTLQRVLSAMQENRKHSELMNRLSERIESFVVENDVNLLMALSRHLQSILNDSWGLDRTDRLRIGTALEEALLNAMYHGNLEVSSELKEQDHQAFYSLADERRASTPWIHRRIYVRCCLTSQEAKFVIRDDGQGFDPATLPDPTDPENLARPFGRGVMLMRAFMDEVSYNSSGNEVTLRRNRFRV
jgi:CheY-like chemotaxis protein/anti-sigma regulatory factor (Ser/Thr protein kinase)